jgi:hypothetical protein
LLIAMLEALGSLNLIRCFDWYLLIVLFSGLFMRIVHYREIIGMVWKFSGRWPNLYALIKGHRAVFFSWSTLLPASITLTLWIVHMTACRLLWPQAELSIADLLGWILSLLEVIALGSIMIGFDIYLAFKFVEWDHAEVERALDRAEFWMRSWASNLLRLVTFGKINPRKMVNTEIKKLLEETTKQVNVSLWLMTAQVGVRIAFGLLLWTIYLIHKYA